LVKAKYYFDNSIEIDLSGIVLFNDFVRDIELVPMKRQLTIAVSDEETGAPLVADIEVIEGEKHQKIVPETVAGVPGSYSILLREGKLYGINVRGPKGFAFHHTAIDLGSDPKLKQLDIRLKPLKTKIPIKLNNINFEYNSADLIESSYEELIRLIQLINDNPDIKVEIMAHTDDLGSDQYNTVLAEKRAASVVAYMIRNGVANNRLFSKGYGENVPLVPNTSEENRAINRRVEMRILDKDDHVINEIEK
jgi:outer membrane protein OmpA-like peptidoglycan-associated protein